MRTMYEQSMGRGVLRNMNGRSSVTIGVPIPSIPGPRGGHDEGNCQGRGGFVKGNR